MAQHLIPEERNPEIVMMIVGTGIIEGSHSCVVEDASLMNTEVASASETSGTV